MRKIREVLRLRLGHDLSQHAIARSLQLSAGAVNGYLSRARRAGITRAAMITVSMNTAMRYSVGAAFA
jgi:DNA-directed RNA polymerase specialized sigma24 family protein